MPRTASVTGSLRSSPSTSTVYSAVMAPALAGAGAFQQPRQQAEDGRRVPAGGGRFADGEPDLTLRHGEAGDGVEEQEDVLARPRGRPRRSPWR